MVAKSFQDWEKTCDPFQESGRWYVKVRNPKNSNERKVRWYSETEYAKLYGETAKENSEPTTSFKNLKKALGFDKGYITIFKGDIQPHFEWFKFSIARYCEHWGWYIVSTDELPADIPLGITPVELRWSDVSINDETLKPQTKLKEVINSLLYEPSTSEYVGNIGERIEIEVTVVDNKAIDTSFGVSNIHNMVDQNGNAFTWITASKNWLVGSKRKIRGSVKKHELYKNQKTTYLSRCIEI